MKKLVLLMALILALTLLASCGGSDGEETSKEGQTASEKETGYVSPSTIDYDDTVEPSAISEAILNKFDKSFADSLYEVETAFLESDFDLTCIKDCSVYQIASGSVDRFGVFRAKNENEANIFVSSLGSYITKCQETWMTEYDANDAAKLQNAFVRVRGVYVIFGMLSEENCKTVTDTANDLIKEIKD